MNRGKNFTKQFVIDSTTTKVEFDILSDKMIHDYITEYKPFDKAGAYGIQEMPDGYIKNCEGSLENVIGLDTNTVSDLLHELRK